MAVCNRHVGYVDQADRMANSYMATHQTWKWTRKLFFHLLNLAILNSYVLLSSCVWKSHIENFDSPLLAWAGHEPGPSRPVGSLALLLTTSADWTHATTHWLGHSTKRQCHMCSARGVVQKVRSKYVKCDVALCVD